MNVLLLAFVGGAVLAGHLGALPDAQMRVWWAGTTALLALGAVRYSWTRWLASAWCGFFFAVAWAGAVIADRLPVPLVGEDLTIVGTVVSLPQRQDNILRFRFERESIPSWPGASVLVLSWYPAAGNPPPEVLPGQRWALTVRLNRPRGTVNPGLFDYEGWLLAREVSATGYVRTDPPARLLAAAGFRQPHHQVRSWLRQKILTVLQDTPLRGLVLALTIGESNAISTADWNILSRTGTNHLLIISGLHVGLVAAMGYQLCRLAQLSGVGASMLSLAFAAGYGAIAGFGLPVQRSLVMTACLLVGVACQRFLPVSRLICLALVAVILLNPLATLGAGFWLSFGAVGVLLYAFGGRVAAPGHLLNGRLKGRLKDWFVSQWAVFVGTAPLLATQVFQVSLIAPVANLLAIPLVGFLLVPLLLLALVALGIYAPAGEWLLLLAAKILAWVWRLLEALAALDWVFFPAALSSGAVLLAILGTVVLLTPPGLLPRWFGLCMLLPMVCIRAPSPEPGEVWVDVLDVGQGLAVVLQTHQHRVLYDTGPAFGTRFDSGEQIITPWLRQHGEARYLDTLVVSHGDLDHAGGAAAIRRNFTVDRVLGVASGSPIAKDCSRRQSWSAGGTRFDILPLADTAGRENDGSCVLLVRAGNFRALLPGDIEQAGEAALLAVDLPPIDLLLVPHHGSQSSSGPAFLNHVRPGMAVVSAGFGNRFGHPDPLVLRRYAARGVPVLNTATGGIIRIRYAPDTGLHVSRGRQSAPRFWYD